MAKFTQKQLALRIQPGLKSIQTGGITRIVHGDTVIETGPYPSAAWHAAYEKLAAEQFKVGDLLVMVDCMEATHYKGKVWKCRHASFKAHSGDYGAFLEGFAGYFLCAFLRKATPEEASTYQPHTDDALA